MKNVYILLVLLISNTIAFAQVGINTTSPNAMLEIAPSSATAPSNTDGMIVPRISAFPATNPTLAQQGMLVYLTTTVSTFTPGFYYWDNTTTTWKAIAGVSTTGWQLNGNTVNATTDFLGSTNNADVIFKRNNLQAGRIGTTKTSFGLNALKSLTTGTNNTANGVNSLYSNTTGSYNTSNGDDALFFNTTGIQNTANGYASLYANTTGDNNTAFGLYSLRSNTIGFANTANGVRSLYNNTTGTGNTANGINSLSSNSTGTSNTANGAASLNLNTIGSYNTANGFRSLDINTTGNKNSGLGYYSSVGDGLANATAIGSNSLVTTSNSLVLGSINGTNGATADVNVGIGTTAPTERLHVVGNIKMIDGNEALGKVLTSDANGVASWQTAVGGASGWQLTGNTVNATTDFLGSTNDADVIFKRNNLRAGRIGTSNTSYGLRALNPNTTGGENTANGVFSLYSNTEGNRNTANGGYSLRNNTTGDSNTANGHRSLYFNTTGYSNTANGTASLNSNTTGSNNTANGVFSLYSNTEGNRNTANGFRSLYFNTTGYYNTANGGTSLYFNTTGSNNTANGDSSLYNNTSGSSNTAIGLRSLFSNTTGINNTALGSNAFLNGTTFSSSTALGAFSVVSANNQVRVGSALVTSIGGQVGWTTVSDKRFKNESNQQIPGLAFIKKLRPVTYYFDRDKYNQFLKIPDSIAVKNNVTGKKYLESGFMAQEVEQAAKELGYEFNGVDEPKNDGDHYGLRYAMFVVPLVKAVQELEIKLETKNNEIKILLDKNNELEMRLSKIEAMLKK